MKKILFYCQYLSGMGHLIRSTEIVRSLVKNFQVYFINGGPPVQGVEIPSTVEIISLPALWLEDDKFKVEEQFQSVEQVKKIRKHQLISVFDRVEPDCLITEFFPFGRHKLFFELLPLLEHIQSTKPSTKIVCSLRDVIKSEFFPQEAETICQLVNQYFDLILFHADPKFQKFEESFPRYKELNCQIKYTGFVAQSQTVNSSEKDKILVEIDKNHPMILVSVGGGRIGYELLASVIKASSFLEKKIPHKFQIFAGPFLPEANFLKLQFLASKRANVNIQRYTSQFLEYLKKAALSISLTGYNTTMNILKTGVRAIVVPIGHDAQDKEQLVRTQKLERLGIVEVINPNDLEPMHLAQRMIACLNKEPVANISKMFDLQGAEKTAAVINELLCSSLPRE
ncbi:glycosyltransferase family protein [Mastigocladopsis repens]|uniref:glycosyltransferase family protein n=1 Tax=Mastigocladopsis repens TaxID=221287 RepID=UPI0002D48538|nr:glycosyltransferase [Mastigocladopsis repens]